MMVYKTPFSGPCGRLERCAVGGRGAPCATSICGRFEAFFYNPGLREAYDISIASCIASVGAVTMGAVSYFASGSSTALGYTLENFVDGFGSVLVIWRFSGGGDTIPKSVLDSRERLADVGINLSFVLLSAVVLYNAITHLLSKEKPRDVEEMLILYTPSMVIFFVLGLLKIHIARSVRSTCLEKDGACSLAGCLISLGVLVSSVLYETMKIWWLDSLTACVVAVSLGVIGINSLRKWAVQGYKWWLPSFWISAATPTPLKHEPDTEPLLT